MKLAQNPVSNELIILSREKNNNTQVKIIDLTGKIVFESKVSLTNRTVIPLELSSGLYVINLRTKDNLNKQFKLVVNR